MSAYKSLADIIAERHTALLAEERLTDTTTCCGWRVTGNGVRGFAWDLEQTEDVTA